ncbi:hypothetical protein H257_14187 [Aphanomyces astaci]|uniref:Uncharacterized protein n=1 Tax=Aphanomyces astaci TaxID=112090 RepID=W4FS28_APHAT|nr:hypothetical protein H257_14187 [Aphanomyces astaci]ETV70282.1 hypothetical protein H257_14187 [Aphanomyces astaci]|eukprot:XP_009840241.1 hypothetical protein H257_14187 [Aphanomyces astaci]
MGLVLGVLVHGGALGAVDVSGEQARRVVARVGGRLQRDNAAPVDAHRVERGRAVVVLVQVGRFVWVLGVRHVLGQRRVDVQVREGLVRVGVKVEKVERCVKRRLLVVRQVGFHALEDQERPDCLIDQTQEVGQHKRRLCGREVALLALRVHERSVLNVFVVGAHGRDVLGVVALGHGLVRFILLVLLRLLDAGKRSAAPRVLAEPRQVARAVGRVVPAHLVPRDARMFLRVNREPPHLGADQRIVGVGLVLRRRGHVVQHGDRRVGNRVQEPKRERAERRVARSLVRVCRQLLEAEVLHFTGFDKLDRVLVDGEAVVARVHPGKVRNQTERVKVFARVANALGGRDRVIWRAFRKLPRAAGAIRLGLPG